MSEEEKSVKAIEAIQPIQLNRIYRVDDFESEAKYYPQKQAKKDNRKNTPKKKVPVCIMTPEKIDCEV